MAIFVGIKIVLDFQRQSCIANTVPREGEWIYKTTNIVNEQVDDSIIWNQRPVYMNKAATHNYTCCFYKSINSRGYQQTWVFFNVSDDGGIYFEFFDRHWFCGDGCGL